MIVVVIVIVVYYVWFYFHGQNIINTNHTHNNPSPRTLNLLLNSFHNIKCDKDMNLKNANLGLGGRAK